jgi:transcriptional regulator with XRE-family HTH domain
MNTAMDFAAIFSERLKKIRKGRAGELCDGFDVGKQEGFARLLGVTQSQVSDWENLEKKAIYPRVDEVFRIAGKLNIQPAWLLGLSETDREQNPFKNNSLMINQIAEILEEQNDAWKVTIDTKEKTVNIFTKNTSIFTFTNEFKDAIHIEKTAKTERIRSLASKTKNEIIEEFISLSDGSDENKQKLFMKTFKKNKWEEAENEEQSVANE